MIFIIKIITEITNPLLKFKMILKINLSPHCINLWYIKIYNKILILKNLKLMIIINNNIILINNNNHTKFNHNHIILMKMMDYTKIKCIIKIMTILIINISNLSKNPTIRLNNIMKNKINLQNIINKKKMHLNFNTNKNQKIFWVNINLLMNKIKKI